MPGNRAALLCAETVMNAMGWSDEPGERVSYTALSRNLWREATADGVAYDVVLWDVACQDYADVVDALSLCRPHTAAATVLTVINASDEAEQALVRHFGNEAGVLRAHVYRDDTAVHGVDHIRYARR